MGNELSWDTLGDLNKERGADREHAGRKTLFKNPYRLIFHVSFLLALNLLKRMYGL